MKITKSEIAKQPIKIRDNNLNKEIPYPAWIPLPKRIVQDIQDRYDSFSVWIIIWWLLRRSPKIIYLIFKIIQLTNWSGNMPDSKTTKFANTKLGTLLITILTAGVTLFGFDVGPEFVSAIVMVGATIYGLIDQKQGKATKDAE